MFTVPTRGPLSYEADGGYAAALIVRGAAPPGPPKPRLLDRVRAVIRFLYRDVLDRDLPWPDDVVRAKGPQRLLVVLTRAEVRAVIRSSRARPDCVPHSLVAIDERVPLNQREAQGCGLFNQRGIQVDATEDGFRLGDGADSSTPTSRIPDAPPVASRRRRCNSTTSPSVRYRIRRGAGTTPRSSAVLARPPP